MKYAYIFFISFLFSTEIIAQSKTEQSLLQSIEKLRIAMINADKSSLENLITDSLSYGHSSGRVENKKEFVENVLNGKSDFVTIELSEQTISISKNIAIVRHILNAQTNDNGNPGSVKLKVLMVWIKQKKDWNLIARQAVKIQ